MKTLDQVDARLAQIETRQSGAEAKLENRTPITSLPFTIANSGSYYLAGPLRVGAGVSGITVSASHVTIDLNGFLLRGAGSNTAITGTGQTNIEVRNGVIEGWSVAIDLLGVTAARVENVRAVANSGGGISVGNRSAVLACTASGNGVRGIRTGDGSVISKCVVAATTGNLHQAVSSGDGCLIVDTIVQGSTGADTTAIRVFNGGSVIRCAVNAGSGNNANAIVAANGCKIIDCVVEDNAGTGSDGILAGALALVSGCTVSGNGGDGVVASSGSVVQHNTASGNGGTGFRLTADRNRLEGNHAYSNVGTGIIASGGGATNNLIIRNSAAANTGGDFIIGAGNAAAGVVSAANVAANTNPHANFDLD